jgi:hypothetical protein
MGIWRLKGVRGSTDWGMCPMRNKEESWSCILRCEETSWREEFIDKRFASIEPEIRIRRIVTKIMTDQKIWLYLSKYKEKCKRSVRKLRNKS